ncbi:hypothetical protein QL285_003563 [Trifolium repens]|nr:hypothetical protein QL285_003563 [Trifolium repens]
MTEEVKIKVRNSLPRVEKKHSLERNITKQQPGLLIDSPQRVLARQASYTIQQWQRCSSSCLLLTNLTHANRVPSYSLQRISTRKNMHESQE